MQCWSRTLRAMSDNQSDSPYPELACTPSYPAIEGQILDYWASDNTFQASVDLRATGDEYVFYDGPPFANGLPHYGHLITGFVKDTVPRYQTMRGKKVERRFGWDCHGLPAEMEAEKQLGISGHVAIEAFGVDKFNDYCRESVLRYTSDWRRYVTRMARWVDFDNDYKTMDLPYMESVMWAFRQLWDKGLIYEGYRVVPYCWECETPLSNFETKLDDAYRERQDQAVTVRFQISDDSLSPELRSIAAERNNETAGEITTWVLAWTTTPWTLPSNLALAVNPDITYAVFAQGNDLYVLAEALTEKYEHQLRDATQVGTIGGGALVGSTYAPLFDFFDGHQDAFKILAGDFVTADDGTGVVHIAPGFGEDDQRLCEANGIAVVVPVDEAGKFVEPVSTYAGVQVFEANSRIIADLKTARSLIKQESYLHNYPHCWRTDTPLIYKAVSSWFVEVTKIKDRAVELNQNINWFPEHIKDGVFGNWLAGARDWNISRNRFWGSPIPVWKSDNPDYPRIDVYGSLDDIERDFGIRPDDLHRPGIDNLTRPNPDDPTGTSTMRRVEQVLDCWFESGSMPYAQAHYPFERGEWFQDNFPADFIVEYVSQVQSWFYNLHVLATALFDSHAFGNCISHGVLLGSDGRKISKRLRNYPDVEEVFTKQGADAMRWLLLSSPIMRGLDLIVEEKAITDAVRSALNPIWNASYFFTLYANIDGVKAVHRTEQTGVLDRYALAKAHDLITNVTTAMDAYDLAAAHEAISTFVDALNNWYIRRSRDRFWSSELTQDKQDAYDTLYTVLTTLYRVAAPFLPLLAEHLYRCLTSERSVHLTDWPEADSLPAAPDLVEAMDRAREVASAGLSIRKAANLRVRLPLAQVTIAGAGAASLQPYVDLIADELNVKNVKLTASVEGQGELQLALNPSALGPRLGSDTQKVMKAVREGRYKQGDNGSVSVEGHILTSEEATTKLVPLDAARARPLADRATLVVLDTELTTELEQEGLARDVVRAVQQARRDALLHVSDRIVLSLRADGALREAIATHNDYIAEQTLAVSINDAESGDSTTVNVDGSTLSLLVERAG